MGEEDQKVSSWFSAANVISIGVGIASVAVSLFLFYVARETPELLIDQLPAVSYASPMRCCLSSLDFQRTIESAAAEVGPAIVFGDDTGDFAKPE